jgi:hypothetical protein
VDIGVIVINGKILWGNVGDGGNEFESAVSAAGVKE